MPGCLYECLALQAQQPTRLSPSLLPTGINEEIRCHSFEKAKERFLGAAAAQKIGASLTGASMIVPHC